MTKAANIEMDDLVIQRLKKLILEKKVIFVMPRRIGRTTMERMLFQHNSPRDWQNAPIHLETSKQK